MVIYLDIILLLNLAINTLLIWFTAYFRKEPIIWWRIFAAAAFGSTYIAFFFFPSFAGMYQWFGKFIFSVLMLLISFPYRRITSFVQTICIFYFLAFVFGGGVFGLEYFLSTQSEIVNGILITHNDGFGVGTKPTFIILASGFVLVYVLSRKSYQAIQEPRKLEAFLVEVIVKVNGKSILCRGLVDTGNQLHEPITRIPVMVIEQHLFAHILPQEILNLVRNESSKLEKMDVCLDALTSDWQARIRLIPFRSVSRGMDFMVAIKPDSVTVIQNGIKYDTQRVLVGLHPIGLAADGKYQAIVHPNLVHLEEHRVEKSLEQEG